MIDRAKKILFAMEAFYTGTQFNPLLARKLKGSKSMFLMSQDLSPVEGSSGFEVMETDTFRLHCFQTPTGEYHDCQQRDVNATQAYDSS